MQAIVRVLRESEDPKKRPVPEGTVTVRAKSKDALKDAAKSTLLKDNPDHKVLVSFSPATPPSRHVQMVAYLRRDRHAHRKSFTKSAKKLGR